MLYIVKLSRRPNSVKYSRARSHIKWLNGGTNSALVIRAHRPDDEDRVGTRNARLLAIQPPDAAACPRIFYYSSFALLHFNTEENVAAWIVWFVFHANSYLIVTTSVI